jgi:hypothetical protein
MATYILQHADGARRPRLKGSNEAIGAGLTRVKPAAYGRLVQKVVPEWVARRVLRLGSLARTQPEARASQVILYDVDILTYAANEDAPREPKSEGLVGTSDGGQSCRPCWR